MTVVVPPAAVDQSLAVLRERGEQASVIGEIRSGTRGVVIE
jgi:phosphoribosylaminoimidazole (AIR) synthetase